MKGFTLLVAAYEPLAAHPDIPGVSYDLIPGPKISGYVKLFERDPGLLDRYTHIALIDDDIKADASSIRTCFDLGVALGLDIWQPSLTWDSHFSYAAVLNNPLMRARYTNFVEMMCPFFSANALKRALPLLRLGYEVGIDRFWCRLSNEPMFRYAILDAVTVTHTRPMGATQSRQGMAAGYASVLSSVDETVQQRFYGPVAYAGILKGGARFNSRLVASCAASLGFGALPRTPVGKGFCAMRVLDHVRHNLTRPLNDERISVPDRADVAVASG